LNSFVKGF